MEQDHVRSEQELSAVGNGDSLSRSSEQHSNSEGREDNSIPARDSIHTEESVSDTISSSETQQVSESIKDGIKKPIFIATAEGRIAELFEQNLFNKRQIYSQGFDVVDDNDPLLNKDEYTLLVVNPEIYQRLREQYLFSLMKEDEQQRASQISINKELCQKALTQALQINDFIINWNDTRNCMIGSGDEIQIVFNQQELRVILNKMKHLAGEKGRLTHQDTWNIMDLLLLQGFITIDNPLEEIHTREKRKYRLIINQEDKLKSLRQQKDQCLYLQAKYKDQESSIENQIQEIESKMNNKDAPIDDK